MAIKFTNTQDIPKRITVVVYGESGIGKTRLIETCPTPLIISSEKKLISLAHTKIPVATIEDHKDLQKILDDMVSGSKKYQKFETVVLDSISDIAECVLDYFKKNPENNNTHPQAAYGSLADHLIPLIKKFRDVAGKHVYVIAKTKRMDDAYTSIPTWMPSLPGQQLGPGLPYMFDYVFAMRKGEMDNGKGKIKKFRYLMTQPDIQWMAKGHELLSAKEKPDLGAIFNKLLSGLEGMTKKKSKKQENQKGEEKEENTEN